MNSMESNAAERLKIMAQQHQSTSQGACGSPMSSMPSSMAPQRMGSIDQMGGQPGGYLNSMQQSSMSNGHINSDNMSPGGMQASHHGQPQLVRGQNTHSRNVGGQVPNLPTMPLPPPMSSPMMTSGAQASTSDTTSMSTMSVAQMQQLPHPPHQHGSMHNMANSAMGNMTTGLMGNATNGPANCGEGGGPSGGMTMYHNVSHPSMVDPAMVQRSQGRYRLGTPNGNPNMRPGMHVNHGNQAMPGRNSPLGSGMQQPPVISNHNVRQQVSDNLQLDFRQVYRINVHFFAESIFSAYAVSPANGDAPDADQYYATEPDGRNELKRNDGTNEWASHESSNELPNKSPNEPSHELTNESSHEPTDFDADATAASTASNANATTPPTDAAK